MLYIIEDWAGNRCFPDKDFETHDDASNYLLGAVGEDEELGEYYVVQKLPDVGNTQARIAGEIAVAMHAIGKVMEELSRIADECNVVGLHNTETDIGVALGRLGYAKEDCLAHRTRPPLG